MKSLRDRNERVGRWRLVSYVGRREDGEVTLPLGEKPHGSLLHTADGWMTAQICAADRAAMETRDIRGGSNHERVAAFSSYIAYCGSYEVTGDVVVHYVEMSLFPNWVGTEQTRTIELADDELVLRTRPLEVGGQVLVNELRWRREDE